MPFRLRLATADDVPELTALMCASIRVLQAPEYTEHQREAGIRQVYGIDTQLIADGTYFAVVDEESGQLVACGGWSKRRTLFGGDQYENREPDWLDPATEAAKVRAFFVHPDWARRGLGTLLLTTCEQAAVRAGFQRCEMGSTLTGVALYKRHGYEELDRIFVPLENADQLEVVRMAKAL